jgi:hypothetical protein
MKIRLPLMIAIIALCSASGRAQQQIKPTYRVSLEVSAKDEIKPTIVSYVSRELRALGDILIVESEPEYLISIVAMQPKNKAGNSMGYVISTVVTSHMSLSLTQLLIHGCKDAETLSQIIPMLGLLETHDLAITDVEGLEKKCKEIVASIDGDLFEKKRKEHQKVMDSFNKPTPTTNSPKKP